MLLFDHSSQVLRPLSPLTEALECCCRNCLQEASFHTFEFFPLCLLQCCLWPNKLGPRSFSLYIQGLITEVPLAWLLPFLCNLRKGVHFLVSLIPKDQSREHVSRRPLFSLEKSRKIHLLHPPFPDQSGATITFLRWLRLQPPESPHSSAPMWPFLIENIVISWML